MLRWLAVVAALVVAQSLHAQAYPSQSVRIVVAFGPGAATDLFARLVAQYLQDPLGQSVLVDNKPGANGSIAAEFVARAKPDGYTLMFSTATAHASNVWLMKQLRYDPIKDFEPITRLGTLNFVVAVPADSPYRSVADMIADAKARPGRVSIATANATGTIAAHSIIKWAGAEMIAVPYKSSPQALTDMLGGRVSTMISDTASGAGWLKSGKIRGLAVTGARRSGLYPNLPTLDEVGMKGFDLTGWFGLYAPAGTPRTVVGVLNARVKDAINVPELRTKAGDLGLDVFSSTSEALAEHTRAEIRAWERYVKDAGLQPE